MCDRQACSGPMGGGARDRNGGCVTYLSALAGQRALCLQGLAAKCAYAHAPDASRLHPCVSCCGAYVTMAPHVKASNGARAGISIPRLRTR